MIRVLRLMEYTYRDVETMNQDMARWVAPATGEKRMSPNVSIRSATMFPAWDPQPDWEEPGSEALLPRFAHPSYSGVVQL